MSRFHRTTPSRGGVEECVRVAVKASLRVCGGVFRARIHAETNKAIPKDLLEKLLKAENYDQGFSTVEYVSSALVDLAFHNETLTKDPMQKQKEVLDRIKMPESLVEAHWNLFPNPHTTS